jgi:general stress protein YciG
MTTHTTPQETPAPTQKARKQGFASLSPQRRHEVASLGGKAAHRDGNAHEWTHEEAVAAGRKGGTISRRKPRKKIVEEEEEEEDAQ